MYGALYLASSKLSTNLYFAGDDAKQMASEGLDNGEYEFGGQIEVAEMLSVEEYGNDVELIADEIFDLTNNPSRQEEREEKYGRGRSMTVGDIVRVGNTMVLCVSCGWEKL